MSTVKLNSASTEYYKNLMLNLQIAEQRMNDFVQAQGMALGIDASAMMFDPKQLAFVPLPAPPEVEPTAVPEAPAPEAT